jgi:flagellar biosynthesis protein FlhA
VVAASGTLGAAAADLAPEPTLRGQIAVGAAVVGILGVLLVALPPILLDVGLVLNLAIGLLLLLVALYARRPLDLSAFPTILLLVTLFRLSLNIASTRLILLNGDHGTSAAGAVIEAFGEFVVGGSFVVGIVVFLLFVIVNFVVITRGSSRIAEVAARFTLDAMPGKQMAIDADLNNGVIDEAEGRRRRTQLQAEADFYGAMDGASKFVRGDAVAGVLIIITNVIGGFGVGVSQHGMTIAEAASTYTLLTVGDGLVTAVPALLISIAAGLIVTRSGGQYDLSVEIARQLWSKPTPLWLGSVVLGLLALVPALPNLAFGLLSAGLALGARHAQRQAAAAAETPRTPSTSSAPERPADLLQPPDPLELQVGYGLIELVDPNRGGELLERIRTLRREFTSQMGFPVPLIHVRDNLRLPAESYSILVRGVPAGRGEILSDHLLAIAPPGAGANLPGIETRDPTFGLPARWIKPAHKDQAQAAGYTVVDPPSVVVTHLSELIRRHASDLVGRQAVQEMLDAVAQRMPKLVSEVVPEQISLGGVQKVVQNLLREGVPVRDLPTILEALGDYGSKTRDSELLTELVRERLSAQISAQVAPSGALKVLVLAPDVEQMVSGSIQRSEHGSLITLDAGSISKIVGRIREMVARVAVLHPDPTILCSPDVRPHLRKMTERFLPRCAIVSANELAPSISVESIGSVTLGSEKN